MTIRQKIKIRLLMMALWSLGLCALAGDISYDPDAKAIKVVGFPKNQPAILKDLFQADQAGAWGKVKLLEPGPGYSIEASLWIGDDSGIDSYLLLEAGEQLELSGNLWVKTPAYKCFNNFQAGRLDASDRRSTLRIRCAHPAEFWILLGDKTRLPRNYVELLLYHTDVAALEPPLRGRDGAKRPGPPAWNASRIVFEDCRISGMPSLVLDGANYKNATIRDTIFENCDRIFALNRLIFERCVLCNNRIALDRPVACTLIDCQLKDNAQDIVWPENGLIMWIDTGVGLAGTPPVSSDAEPTNDPGWLDQEPLLTEYRLAVIETATRDGRPLAGASIVFQPHPHDARAVVAPEPILTGGNGRTSADVHMDAVLLVRARWYRANNAGVAQFYRLVYSYDINVKLPDGKNMSTHKNNNDLYQPEAWCFTADSQNNQTGGM